MLLGYSRVSADDRNLNLQRDVVERLEVAKVGQRSTGNRARTGRGEGDAAFHRAGIGRARFFADHILWQAPGLRTTIIDGSAGVPALSEDRF